MAIAARTLIVVVAALAWCNSARADDRTGFEPTILGGVGGVVNDSSTPPLSVGERKPSFALHGLLGYRLFQPLDVGLHVFHQWQEVDGLARGDSAYSSAAGGGVFVRLHPLEFLDVHFVDPAVGAGIDLFAYERQDTTFADRRVADRRDARNGAMLPLLASLDAPVFSGLSVGATAIWAPWFNDEVCTSRGTGLPACNAQTQGPLGYFFVGVGLRLHLRFVD